MQSDSTPDPSDAFPEPIRSRARVVLSVVLPTTGSAGARSADDIGAVTLGGQSLRIPARIYYAEPDWASVHSRGVLDETIVGCLFSRHHDGHVRERALTHMRAIDEAWVAPFGIQLLGEYVIEIVERAAAWIGTPPRAVFVACVRENPGFLERTTARATSYWNEYYRQRFPFPASYPALMALARLRASMHEPA